MGGRALFLLLTVSWVTFGYLALSLPPQECLQDLAGVKCRCGLVNRTLQVFCSCLSVKTVDLRNLSQDHIVTDAVAFHLEHCQGTSVLVFPGAFRGLTSLQRLTFHNMSRLTLETHSIVTQSWVDVFSLVFSSITNLSIRKNAVNVQSKEPPSLVSVSVRMKHCSLISLMKFAIVGQVRDLTLEEMLVKARPWPRAVVCQGSAGASVALRSVTVKKGLTGTWITGNVSRLSITSSHLRLLPDAFAGLNMVEGKRGRTGIVLIGNNFMLPFLPSHALPARGSLKAADNHIVCRCQNLVWLVEPPNTPLKQGVKDSLTCRKKKDIDSVLASCETQSLSTA